MLNLVYSGRAAQAWELFFHVFPDGVCSDMTGQEPERHAILHRLLKKLEASALWQREIGEMYPEGLDPPSME
jgi:hypothetical protein